MEVVTGAMGNLLPKLGELLMEFKLQKGVKTQVESLRRELQSMHAALRKVSEVPRDQLDEQVKLWARDVRELAYDMEDVVDTFLVRVEDGREATNQHWLKRLLEKMGSLFSEGKTQCQIADAIKDINKQAQEVANRRGRYTVDSIVAKPDATSTIDPRLFAMYKNASQLVGVDGPRDALIKMLSEGDDASKKKMKIVSVVGFGGLGKTTLATAVYHKLKADFNCHAFVLVGQNPDMKKVLKDILIGLDKQKYTNLNMTVLDERQLIDELREFLENKRDMMRDLTRRNDKNIGFVDPYIVFKDPNTPYDQWRPQTERNFRRFLINQKNKRFILFPYNFGFHWILIVFDLSDGHLLIYDSLRKPQEDYQDMIDIIQGVWAWFVQLHRPDLKAPLPDPHRLDWVLRQPPGNNLCGYYVCEFLMVYAKRTHLQMQKEIWLKEQVLDMDRLKGIQETIAGFLNEHVLKPGTEFYFNPDEQLKPNQDEHLYDI